MTRVQYARGRMSEESKTESTEIESTEPESPEAPAAEEVEKKAEAEEEEDEEEEDEDDEKDDEDDEDDEKDDKDDKGAIDFEATLPRSEAVSYFEAIIAGLKSGRLEFRQGEDSVVFNLPDRVELEVEAKLKGDKGKIEFEIQWSKKTRALEISS